MKSAPWLAQLWRAIERTIETQAYLRRRHLESLGVSGQPAVAALAAASPVRELEWLFRQPSIPDNQRSRGDEEQTHDQ